MTPIEVVTNFLDRWNTNVDEIRASMRDTFSPDCVWDNVNMSVTRGAEEAMPMIDSFVEQAGFARMPVDMINITADGNKVWTERVDRFVNGDGVEFLALRVMGIFEVGDDGKIHAWRDYYDSRAMG